jgi:ABC-type spermidine/putrescine transport system permease subunit II
MTLRNLFLINVVVALIFALVLLLGPAYVLTAFGLRTGPSENLVAQLFGATLLVPALLAWFAKDLADPEARRGIVLSLFVSDIAAFVITLLGILAKTMKSSGWTVAIVYLAFALGYGYLQFMKQSEM